MYKIKDDIDLNELVAKYNFIETNDYYIRVHKTRDVYVIKFNREVIDFKKDCTTYTGYAYSNEYRHNTGYYIKDLIASCLVDVIKS